MRYAAAIPLATIAYAAVASALANEVAVPPVGKSTVVKTWDALPRPLRGTVGRDCGTSGYYGWSVEIYGVDAEHDFAILNCSFGVGTRSKVYDLTVTPPAPVTFVVVVDQTSSEVTEFIGGTSLEVETGNLSHSLYTDSCGIGEENPTYEYQFRQGRYELIRIEMWSCETDEMTRVVWSADQGTVQDD